jgi:cysteine synthase A
MGYIGRALWGELKSYALEFFLRMGKDKLQIRKTACKKTVSELLVKFKDSIKKDHAMKPTISPNVLGTIGNTPMIKVGKIFAKLETTNPSGSIKDRMALYIIEKAEKAGKLKKGQTIIEITSGSTGIAFAMVAALKGYKFLAIMPGSMSVERVKIMKLFGAKIILTPAEKDIEGAFEEYERVVKKNKSAFFPRQFSNEDNVEEHKKFLGKEILHQMNGKVDAFVAGAGTGGTIIGVGLALKKVNPKVKIVVVEPSESAVLSGGKPGIHQIYGIGEGFVPDILQRHRKVIDEVIAISTKDAFRRTKELAKENGLLVGISSGANVIAAEMLAKKYKNVVTVLPDRGERYLSELVV